MQEALLGILLHFARNSNVAILNSMRDLHLFTIFQEKLMAHWTPLAKERSALGLQLLSERAHLFTLRSPTHPPIRSSFFGLCLFPAKSIRSLPEKCGVHGGVCDPNASFCLIAANAITPLVELLEEEAYGVREAVIGALSTLLADGVDIKEGVEELACAEGVQSIFDLFYSVRQANRLQEKTIWMIERILRVPEYAQSYASDQGLVKALMEALRHGSPRARRPRLALAYLRASRLFSFPQNHKHGTPHLAVKPYQTLTTSSCSSLISACAVLIDHFF
jgi:hypothetical protein